MHILAVKDSRMFSQKHQYRSCSWSDMDASIYFSVLLLFIISERSYATEVATATSLRSPLIRTKLRNAETPSCWERISTGRKLREEYIVRILPVSSLDDCKKECERALFECETISYGVVDYKGQANCMLSDWKESQLDVAEKDTELDPKSSVFARYGSECAGVVPSPPSYPTDNQGFQTPFPQRPTAVGLPISPPTDPLKGTSSGRRLDVRYVDQSLMVISPEECRLLCVRETHFDCKSFSYRRRIPTLSPNCDLSRENSRSLRLAPTFVFINDIDSEFYERTGKGHDCDQRGAGYLWASSSSSPYMGLEKYYGNYGYGGVGNAVSTANDDFPSCFRRSKAGTRLDRAVIRYSVAVRSQRDCEAQCLRMTDFACRMYAFRYEAFGANYGRNKNNCDMSDKSPHELDPYRDLVDDREVDLHERVRFDRECETAPAANTVLTPSGVPRQCFLRTRVGIRLDRRMIRFTLPVNSPLECEQECLRSRYFTCRSFSFRFTDAVGSSDAWHKTTDNCDLSDTDVQEADPTRDLIDDRNYDTWRRTSYGGLCNSGSGYGSGFNTDAGAVDAGSGTGGTRSPSWDGHGVVSTGVWIHSGTVDKQNAWGSEASAAVPNRDKPHYSDVNYNTDTVQSNSGWLKPTPGGAWVTLTGNVGSLDSSLTSSHYGGQAQHSSSDGSWTMRPALGWPSGPTGGSSHQRPHNYEPSSPNHGSDYGDSSLKSTFDRDRDQHPMHVGTGYWSDRHPVTRPSSIDGYRTPSYGSSNTGMSSSGDSWSRPLSADRDRPSFVAGRPDSSLAHGHLDGSSHAYDYNQDEQWKKPTSWNRDRPNFESSTYGTTSSYPGYVVGIGTASQDKNKPGWGSNFDAINEIKPLGCYVSYRSGFNLNRRAVRASLIVRSLAECEAECSRALNFNCRTVSFRLTDSSGGYSRNRNNCFLSDADTRSLDKYLDLTEDRDFHLFARSLYSRECESSENLPIMSGSAEGLSVTVSGVRCRGGTRCRENREAGYWFCETGPNSWDYCCRPNHVCGYTSGFNYPWCYVGGTGNSIAKDQWRPCSDRFAERPYAYLHREDPPNVGSLRVEPRNGTGPEVNISQPHQTAAFTALPPGPSDENQSSLFISNTTNTEKETLSRNIVDTNRSRSETMAAFTSLTEPSSVLARQQVVQWPSSNVTSTIPTNTTAEANNTEVTTSHSLVHP